MILRLLIATASLLIGPELLFAQEAGGPGVNIDLNSFTEPIQFSSSVNLLIAISAIGLLPFLLISTTAFVRFAIILGMLRQALGLNTSPPNQVIMALAMFMTIYVMSPTWTDVYDNAVKPYNDGVIQQEEAIQKGLAPFKDFMLRFTRENDLALFVEFSQIPPVTNIKEVPMFVLIPSYLISELKTAFQIGFLIFIPFLVIDLIVSNVLLSLGMFMLSPVMISLPFKILLFVLADGWNIMIRGILSGFK